MLVAEGILISLVSYNDELARHLFASGSREKRTTKCKQSSRF